jgi:hypothetical protein
MAEENDIIAQLVEEALASRNQPAEPSSLDQPVDAMVYETYPALRSRVAAGSSYDPEYPYGPPTAAFPPPNSEPALPIVGFVSDVAAWLARTSESYFAALQSPPDFVVPKTFGMSAILGIMTALALLFACLRWANAEPVFYFFFSVEALTICLAQMLNGKAPRLASIAAGALILPAFTVAASLLTGNNRGGFVCLAIVFIPFGAVLGYLTGTCAAGIFLVMDFLERYIPGYTLTSSSQSRSPSP